MFDDEIDLHESRASVHNGNIKEIKRSMAAVKNDNQGNR